MFAAYPRREGVIKDPNLNRLSDIILGIRGFITLINANDWKYVIVYHAMPFHLSRHLRVKS